MKKLLLLTLLSAQSFAVKPTVPFIVWSGTVFVASISNAIRLIKKDQGKKIVAKPVQTNEASLR